jgi:hypothetical protein
MTFGFTAVPCHNNENLGDRAVNFRDFARLAASWLDKKFWPE